MYSLDRDIFREIFKVREQESDAVRCALHLLAPGCSDFWLASFSHRRASFNISCPAGVRVSYYFYLACWKMLLFYIQGIIMDIESQVGYFSFSLLKMSFHWLLAFVVSDSHSQSLIFSSLIMMCFLVWFYHCVCVLFYLVCLDSWNSGLVVFIKCGEIFVILEKNLYPARFLSSSRTPVTSELGCLTLLQMLVRRC